MCETAHKSAWKRRTFGIDLLILMTRYGSRFVFSSREWSDDAGVMRRFGLALARDDRFVADDAAAAALVDALFRQASLTLIDDGAGEPRSARVGAFAQFIRLYRRHVRAMAAEDAEGGWGERDRKSTRLNSSHMPVSRMPSSA